MEHDTWFLLLTAVYTLLFSALAWVLMLGLCLTAIRLITGEREVLNARVVAVLTVCVLVAATVGAATAVYQHDAHVEREAVSGEYFERCAEPECMDYFRALEERADEWREKNE